MKEIAIVGGGPAGLRAAEVAARGGAVVAVYEARRSVGRKLLVAGRGGLNLTKAEPLERFLGNYEGPDLPRGRWNEWITAFDPDASREWARSLGIETFAASTGRVYPTEMKAAVLLRRWVQRLRELGVQFFTQHRLTSLRRTDRLELEFATPAGTRRVTGEAAILALGGGSWPETGSDGQWLPVLRNAGIAVADLEPANCGWEVKGSPEFLTAAEGQPVKNVTVRAGERTAVGELLITRYGLEGGAIYQLGSALRSMAAPRIHVDLKPALSPDQLRQKMGPAKRNLLAEAKQRLKLSEAALALLRSQAPAELTVDSLIEHVKALPIPLARPRPLAEAISSAGGVRWNELDDSLMLRALPGVFCAGEMIDWEAPTGGYLMQGCLATGTFVGTAAVRLTLPG